MRSNLTREARRLECLYDTKAHGTKHTTIMRLLQNVGLEGTIQQLEAWGMRPVTTDEGPPTKLQPRREVGVTQWKRLRTGEVYVHEFHLRLRSRPVHLALVGASLRAVQVARERDTGERVTLNDSVAFSESSVEAADADPKALARPGTVRALRTDYELAPLEVRDNWVVFVEVESNMTGDGDAALHLIFEPDP